MSWPAWAAGASLLFALLTAAGYFRSAVAGGLMAAGQLAVLALIATGAGRALAGVLGPADAGDSEKTLLGATLGLGLLSLGTTLLAALHALRPLPLFLMLALLALAALPQMRPAALSFAAGLNLLRDRALAAGAVLVPLALVFWTTWVPPHQYDSLVYHLPLPEAYLRAGGLVTREHLLYSHFPQNGEMLFALALLLKSDLLAQMFMWLALALSLWWIFELGKREAPLPAVLLSCLMLSTHTAIMLLASTTYVECLVMLWTTAAVFSFFRWRVAPQRGWLVLSAVFTGLALGTKYYAGITAGILGAFLAARLWTGGRAGTRARALDLALFAGLATMLFGPWLLKNVLAVGNPFFPFFYRQFPMAAAGWSAESASGYFQVLTEYGHAGSFWRDLRDLPLMLLTNSLRFGRGMDVLGGLGWELLFWLLPLGAWAAWGNRFMRGLVLFCGLYLAAWFATGVVLRFLAVLAPLLCLLAGCGLYRLWGLLGPWGRWALGGGVGILSLTHVLLFLFVQVGVFQGAGVLLGIEDRGRFLSRRLDYYPCARYAAEHVGKNDKILVVGEQRGYYLEQDHRTSSVHGPNPHVVWANQAGSPEDLARRIRAEGFGWILSVPREAARLGASLGALTETGSRHWSGLESRLQVLFRGPACTLYAVAGSPRS